jgi:hypothetical protein
MVKTEIIQKVIQDRIQILDSFIESSKNNNDAITQSNRDDALRVKESFNRLSFGIEEYTNLLNGGGDANQDLADKIKEIVSITIIPLIEHNKQKIDSYNQAIHNFQIRQEEINNNINLSSDANGPLKEGLNGVSEMISQYEDVKKSTQDYVQEYELALEQIKTLIAGEQIIEENNENPII